MIVNMKVDGGWLPGRSTASKLFVTGATIGPAIDSLHNQCLLRYQVAPIVIPNDVHEPHLFCSSWLVPPLLGVAYVIMGALLPRVFQHGIDALSPVLEETVEVETGRQSSIRLGLKAVTAVATTAAIIKLSEYLVLHPEGGGGVLENTAAFESATLLEQQLLILITAAVVQWAYLDGTLATLLVASLSSIGGPLFELPFVAAGVWEYLPKVSDYFPLAGFDAGSGVGMLFSNVFGKDYQSLGLSSITGPCYFAVAVDSISLGRFFDATSREEALRSDIVNGDDGGDADVSSNMNAISHDATSAMAVVAAEDPDDVSSTA